MKKISLLLCLVLNIFVNTFSLLAQSYQVRVRNDLYGDDGGYVGVAVSPNTPVSYSSPKDFSGGADDHVTVRAYDDQTVNGIVWFFNDTEYENEPSEWRWINESSEINSFLSDDATFTDPLTMSELDEGDEFVAFLKNVDYTTSGTMSSDERWFSDVTLSDNLTVADGVTLTILSGTTVTIPHGKKIQVNGTVIANNATFQPVSGDTWYGIQFYNCSSNSEVIGCEITGSTYGLDMYYYSNVKLRYNDISSNHCGMLFSSYSDGNGGVLRNDVESNDYGVFCVNYSDPCLYETAFIDNDIAIVGDTLFGIIPATWQTATLI